MTRSMFRKHVSTVATPIEICQNIESLKIHLLILSVT